jgi:hypothetical protein
VSDGACTITFGTAGDYTLTAAYSGDASFGGSTSDPVTHRVDEAEPPPPPGT